MLWVYLSDISAVTFLKSPLLCFITYFLLNGIRIYQNTTNPSKCFQTTHLLTLFIFRQLLPFVKYRLYFFFSTSEYSHPQKTPNEFLQSWLLWPEPWPHPYITPRSPAWMTFVILTLTSDLTTVPLLGTEQIPTAGFHYPGRVKRKSEEDQTNVHWKVRRFHFN